MKLRKELQPPEIDSNLLEHLTELAEEIDGGYFEDCQSKVAEFNQLSGANLQFMDFQGIYGAMEHKDFVLGLLRRAAIIPQANITRDELIEITKRALLGDEAYLDILELNVSYPMVSDLIYWEDFPITDDGKSREEKIADFLLNYKKTEISKPEQIKLYTKHIEQGLSKDEFRILSENLEGFELNALVSWSSKNRLNPSKAIELIHAGKIKTDNSGAITYCVL